MFPGVTTGFIRTSLIFYGMDEYKAMLWLNHYESKNDPDEYNAYDYYFYGKNRSYGVVMAFKQAWLKHIHRNTFLLYLKGCDRMVRARDQP